MLTSFISLQNGLLSGIVFPILCQEYLKEAHILLFSEIPHQTKQNKIIIIKNKFFISKVIKNIFNICFEDCKYPF